MGRVNWFPGHMAAAMATLKRLLRGPVDLVLEVRDARVPLSSANPKLEALLQGKRRIVVLSKADLVPRGAAQAALRALEAQGLRALPASAASPPSVRRLLAAASGWLAAERSGCELSIMMVVGLPNSGKSSLINALKLAARSAGALGGEQAHQRRAAVGAAPGLTRQVSGFQVCAAPSPVYVLDTPGIMPPNVPDDAAGFRLALAGAGRRAPQACGARARAQGRSAAPRPPAHTTCPPRRAGAVRDSVVGEEAIVRQLLALLAAAPRHRAALRAAQAPGFRPPGRGPPGGARPGGDRLSPQRVRAMRAALADAADALAGVAGHGGAAGAGGAWHPGVDDASFDASDVALDLLLSRLGAAGGTNPQVETGAYIRLLQAFRAGELGRYMLDNLDNR
ncbi:SIN2 [Scenedesmus sp. PABB004]|nr:SIN2 [Scenedesmus sp. PABB004]